MKRIALLAFFSCFIVCAGLSCTTAGTGGGGTTVDCKANPSDPACKPKLGPVKLKADTYKGNKKCSDPTKCAAYSDGKDSNEVRCTATRRDSTSRTDVPTRDQKLRFSVDLPKEYEGETPLSLSCSEGCTTGEDGVAKTVVTSTYKTGVELPIKCELQDSKSKTSAKATVRFKEPVPQVTVTVQDGKLVMGRGTSDEAVIQATVQLGTTTPPSGAAVQFSVADTDTAKFATTTSGTTLAGSINVSLDTNGFALARLRPIPATSQNVANKFLRVEVTAAFGTSSTTGYAYIVVGTGPAVVLSVDKSVADADGASSIKVTAGVADKNGARVAGATVRFETDSGIFPNRSKSYEVQSDSSGNASADLISLQPSSGTVKATVVSSLENCPSSGCTSQLLTVTFVGTAISCDIGKIGKLDLTYESCPAGPEVTPCRVQNDDDPDTTPVDNEVTILGRALDSTSKPLSNQVIRFCTCLPHRVETSTRGTIATTDGAGLARITFKAGFQPETTGVLGYVGCPSVDPCAGMCGESGGGGTSSSESTTAEIIQKQIPIIVTSSSGYTIEFDQTPIIIGVLGTGNDTAELKIAVKDQSGNPVRDKTQVRFYIVKGGGGETLASEAGAKTDEAFEETIEGEATTRIRGGTVPGNVQVGVDVTVPNGNKITGTIQNIIIQSGPPVTDHFGLAETPFNIIGFLVFGEKVDVTAFVGDRYGNPPTPGTSVFFATEAGTIQGGGGKQLSDTGSVTATMVSAMPLPRQIESFPAALYCPNDFFGSETSPSGYDDPSDGRGTIVAYTKGSEGFIDMDGDGLYLEDGGCLAGKQCPADQPGCTTDPAEGNGTWDECDDRGSGPRDGVCQSNEFNSCDDRDRNGTCSDAENALPKVCKLGEDIFCILCTNNCGTSVNIPTDGFSKVRHKDTSGRDTTKMPDKACQNLMHDRGEPFINSNECYLGDARYPDKDLDEIFFDLNGNGVYDPPNGRYESTNAPVWDEIRVVWSDQVSTFNIECKPRTASGNCGSGCTGTYLSNQEFLIADKCGADFVIHLEDKRHNPVIAGCSLTVTFPSGSSTSGGGSTTGCTNPTQTAPTFAVADCVGTGSGCTEFLFSFTDPDICTSSPTTISATITVDLSGCKNLGPSGSAKISTIINGKYQ